METSSLHFVEVCLHHLLAEMPISVFFVQLRKNKTKHHNPTKQQKTHKTTPKPLQ